ncbi:MAG: S8 family serine peptidase [Alphaproteobacteria bacterium]|nr:S8 family serine peptidase [Alphaproteobacteria bacterium]
MHRIALLAASLLAATACSNSGMNLPALGLESAGDFVEGELVINADLAPEVAEEHGLEQLGWIPQLGIGLYAVEPGVTRTDIEAALVVRTARADLLVEGNRPREAASVDPYNSLQWNFDLLDLETAWTHNRGAGITVAVLDTGVALYGEDTPVNMLAGWDFAGDDADPTDVGGHGTHVAGTIAQATNNGRGVAGVASDVSILPVRVLGDNGSGSSFWVAQGIVYAVDNGADVINLSLGSAWGSSAEQQAVEYARQHGVVVVAASGNEARGSVGYPAAYDWVIAVGAVDARSAVAPYSNGGSALDVVAPGGDTARDDDGDGYADGILQETIDGAGGTTYQFFQGTSMATPHVSGIAALLLAAGAEPQDVKGLLATTAVDLESDGWDTWSGWGLVNPVAALEAVGSAPAPLPEVDDAVAPTISGVSIERDGASLVIRWTTDEPATSKIAFAGIGEYGDDSLVAVHQLGFQVDPSATYAFDVRSADGAGNTGVSTGWSSAP